MSRGKLRKSKKKYKYKKEDKSKIIDCVDEHRWEKREGARNEELMKSVDCADCADRQTERSLKTGRKEKTAKQVHIALLPDKYEPLEEDQADDLATEDDVKKKQVKYKKFRKNFGKALRYSWKCLVVGLQNLSTAYSGPLSTAITVVPEIQRTTPRA